MLFNYTYRQTKTLEKYQRKLVVYKQVIDLLPRLPHVEENLQRRSLLHSAVFSARIEGNKLTPEAVDLMTWDGRTKEKAKIEIVPKERGKEIKSNVNFP